jgi:UDP-N-acetylmuramate--L-alanine ligase/UDP-N-acetylenolpyruvoylglucosamine reductase
MRSAEKVRLVAELLAQPAATAHLVAVSGSGMIGIAKLLLDMGVGVSGSDLQRGRQIGALEKRGLKFYAGHDAGHVGAVTLLGYSSAIKPANAERVAAAEKKIPQFRRAELLAAIALSKRLFVVSGTHGKTTTSLLLTQIFKAANREPGYYIGADVAAFEFSAGLGGEDLIVEADESDGTLDCYEPSSVLVLNVEADHLDHYEDLRQIEQAFLALAQKSGGPVVLCADDPVCRELVKQLPRALTYGLQHDANYQVADLAIGAAASTFTVLENGKSLGPLTLTLPGKHNVSNALGALTVALAAGLNFADCRTAFAGMRGASRRFDVRYQDAQYLVVDDYAHHPSEIRATLAAARNCESKRILSAFQPHRYSRSFHLLDEFAGAFSDATKLFITDIYAAGEQPIDGVSGEKFAASIRQGDGDRVVYAKTLDDLKTALTVNLEPGDCVLTMGAGNIYKVGEEIARDLRIYRQLQELVDEHSILKLYEPMSRHTSLRIGGPAQFWVEPSNEEVLRKVVCFCHAEQLPLTVIGRGTNLLVLDHGIRGVCLHLGRPAFGGIKIDGERIYAGAGARLKQIVYDARKSGIGGLEFMEGIPGNLGGALRMNAGAMKGETLDLVVSVRCMTPEGEIAEVKREDLDAKYRSVPLFGKNIAISACLHGVARDEAQIAEILQTYSAKRWESQPPAPSAGCTFKNPATVPAGRLIDELGLKEIKCGGARISAVHANFIVNDGGATARDVLDLIDRIRREAREKRGENLEQEIMILGY